MRADLVAVVVGVAAGCAQAKAPRATTVSHEVAPDPACGDAIVAFAEMQLDRWHGLPGCTADDLAAVLGATESTFEGGFGRISRYPGRAATAMGLEVHFAGRRARYVVAFGPRLTPAEIETLLGQPEAHAPSRLFEPHNEQWIFATRGLTFHVNRYTQTPGRVFGYAPMTVAQFKQDDLFYVEAYEVPR